MTPTRSRDKRTRWLIVAAALIVAATFLATLLNYPPPTGDEGLYASAAVSLIERGTVGQTVYAAGDPWDRDVNTTTFGRSYIAGLAIMLRIFGVRLIAARAHAWLGWLAASLLVYWLGSRLYEQQVALLAAFLFATGTKALLTAHLARPESWTTAGVLIAAIAAFGALEAERRPIPLALLAGVVTVWPADFHGVGLAFTVGIVLAVGLRFLQRRAWGRLAAYGGGLLIGLAVWLVLHVGLPGALRGIAGFAGLLRPVQTAGGGGGGGEPVRIVWLDRLATLPGWFVAVFWTAGGPLSLLEGALAVLGSLVALLRGSRNERTLLVMAYGALLVFGFLVPFRHLQYGVLWTPFWYLLGAHAVFVMAEWAVDRFAVSAVRARVIATLALAVLALGNFAGDLWLIAKWRGADFAETGEAIAALVPEDTRVIADTTWWWALRDDRVFLADDYFVALADGENRAVQRFLGVDAAPSPHRLVELALRKLQPDFVIMDRALRSHTDTEPAWTALKDIMEERCSVVGTVPGPWVDDPSRWSTQLGQVSTVYACGGW
jgi:4-amino-4-deoxy-L-arabinose transferase-like glycosyltransferase